MKIILNPCLNTFNYDTFILQMWVGDLPVMTKGPFALTYGGQDILPLLSKEPPPRGVAIFVVGCTIFHAILFLIKMKIQRDHSYINNLKNAMVENVVNVYGIIITIFVAISTSVFIFYHAVIVDRNQKAAPENLSPLLPPTIIVLLSVLGFITVLPFFTRPALRFAKEMGSKQYHCN